MIFKFDSFLLIGRRCRKCKSRVVSNMAELPPLLVQHVESQFALTGPIVSQMFWDRRDMGTTLNDCVLVQFPVVQNRRRLREVSESPAIIAPISQRFLRNLSQMTLHGFSRSRYAIRIGTGNDPNKFGRVPSWLLPFHLIVDNSVDCGGRRSNANGLKFLPHNVVSLNLDYILPH